ncbi:MAG: hypothetical protein J4F28_02535 [Nitrosopumilaceae archaeon]|nr:hypothetical protein [Nitrosopumilaceae archaeon]
MNDAILKKLREKVAETKSNRDEVCRLARLVAAGLGDEGAGSVYGGGGGGVAAAAAEADHIHCVAAGIAAGRLYNAFYYQTRRQLRRDPTLKEFEEFADLVHKHSWWRDASALR